MNANLERERLRAALRSRPIPITVPRLAGELGVDVAVIELFVTTNANITNELQSGIAAVLAAHRAPERSCASPYHSEEEHHADAHR